MDTDRGVILDVISILKTGLTTSKTGDKIIEIKMTNSKNMVSDQICLVASYFGKRMKFMNKYLH